MRSDPATVHLSSRTASSLCADCVPAMRPHRGTEVPLGSYSATSQSRPNAGDLTAETAVTLLLAVMQMVSQSVVDEQDHFRQHGAILPCKTDSNCT